MKYIKSILFTVILVLTGCVNGTAERGVAIANDKLKQEHSPFRWKAISAGSGTLLTRTLVPLPAGPTKADARLTADIKLALGNAELKAGRSAAVKVKEIKPFESSAALIKEVWIIDSNRRSFAYVVVMRTSGTGGTDIGLDGPYEI